MDSSSRSAFFQKMYLTLQLILFGLLQIVSSALAPVVFTEEAFMSDFPAIVEVLKFHRDENDPSTMIIDEIDFVLMDYSQNLPEIIVPVDPYAEYVDDDKADIEVEDEVIAEKRLNDAIKTDKELEL